MKPFPKITVLLYHEILLPGERTNADVGCIPFHTLVDHLNALRAAGFENVSLSDAFRLAATAEPADDLPPRFAVTFDDGYANLHRLLPKIIDRIRPTLFLIQDYLGKSNLDWNPRSPVILEHMTFDQLRDLAACGVELETHGPDHHNLVKFSEDELRSRFQRNVNWFEQSFQFRPRYTAYPYGACNKAVKQVVAEFFAGAASVNHGEWMGAESRYALNRISVPAYLSGNDLVEVISTPPATRWAEVEKRAPWRKSTKP